jgi:hypothetical protein
VPIKIITDIRLLFAAIGAAIIAVGSVVKVIRSDPVSTAIVVVAALACLAALAIGRHRVLRAVTSGDAPPARHAIRGLVPFEKEDKHLLSSRDADMAELSTSILGSSDFHFGALYGDPNCGKTSLVRARILPATLDKRPIGYINHLAHDGPVALEEPVTEELRRLLFKDEPAADLQTLLKCLATEPDKRVLIVWDDFDSFYHELPHADLRRAALEKLRPILGDPDSQVSVLVVVPTDFLGSVGDDYARVFGRNLDATYELKRLPRDVAKKTLKEFVEYDARLSRMPRLTKATCDRIAEGLGLAQDHSVCPAELQIVADYLTGHHDYTEEDLGDLGGADGVLIRFIEERLAAASDSDGLRRRILELFTSANQPLVHLSQEAIASSIDPQATKALRDQIGLVLDKLVDDDLLVYDHERKYGLVHPYMVAYVSKALAGWRPPRRTYAQRAIAAAPRLAVFAGLAVGLMAIGGVLSSWLLFGPHPSGYLPRPANSLLWQSVFVDPTDRFVAAAAAGNQFALWDRTSEFVNNPALPACARNPGVLTASLPPGESAAVPQMLSAGFSDDGSQVQALGTSVITNQLWVATWSTSKPCEGSPWLWGNYYSHLDNGTTCWAADMAYSDIRNTVAVAYKPLPGTSNPAECALVAAYSVAPTGPAPAVSGPQAVTTPGDGLSAVAHATRYQPVKVVFEKDLDRMLVLTQGDATQYIEIFDSQWNSLGPPQRVRYGIPYGVAVSKGHTTIVLRDDPGPFWTRPISTWLSVQPGFFWAANWDSDVNQLRSWIGGLPRISPPAIGVSADGSLIVEIGDADSYPTYEMYGQAGPFRFRPVEWP